MPVLTPQGTQLQDPEACLEGKHFIISSWHSPKLVVASAHLALMSRFLNQ